MYIINIPADGVARHHGHNLPIFMGINSGLSPRFNINSLRQYPRRPNASKKAIYYLVFLTYYLIESVPNRLIHLVLKGPSRASLAKYIWSPVAARNVFTRLYVSKNYFYCHFSILHTREHVMQQWRVPKRKAKHTKEDILPQ